MPLFVGRKPTAVLWAGALPCSSEFLLGGDSILVVRESEEGRVKLRKDDSLTDELGEED
jgi:hypothetical protein